MQTARLPLPHTRAFVSIFSNHQHFAVSTGICRVACPLPTSPVDKPGCKDLIIAVDHKPLLKLFGDRSLDAICNSQLRNLKEKTLR